MEYLCDDEYYKTACKHSKNGSCIYPKYCAYQQGTQDKSKLPEKKDDL